jgi:hypothetical protein
LHAQAPNDWRSVFAIGLLVLVFVPIAEAATYNGATPQACKNCSSCKHCAKDHGTCGVCKKTT